MIVYSENIQEGLERAGKQGTESGAGFRKSK